ncbi:MAG: ABC transporter permease [Bacteroidales bacterium]|nr:ABC transporter permease [Bacteroidales bacterium]
MTLQQLIDRPFRRFAKREAPSQVTSLSALAWRRLCHDPLSVCAMAVILLFALIALLGYLITPDHTPHCNQQYLELTALKPGSSVKFACVYDGDSVAVKKGGSSLIKRMLRGEPLDYTAIPAYSTQWEGDTLVVEAYTGSVPNNGQVTRYHRDNVVSVQKRTFILGTDGYGRDVLSQILIGSRVSLSVGFIAIFIALVIGITLGAWAAYHGGWVDSVIMWFINVVWSIPTVLLVIAITFALGKGFWQVFVAVGLTMWVDIARVVRGQVLGIKEKEYVEAARALGYRTPRIILRHILPNCLGAVIVIAASNFASAILLEAGLSFLGIGVQPPATSWGAMVKENYGYILLDNAYLAILPGLAIMLLVLAFMLLGNGLRNALDVRANATE